MALFRTPLVRGTLFPFAAILAIVLALTAVGAAQTPETPAGEARSASDAGAKEGVSVGIVVDGLAEIWDSSRVRDGLLHFVRSLGPEDEYAVFGAADKPMSLQEFTSEPETIRQTLKRARATHKTALYDTVLAAADFVNSNASNDHKAILVISAGNDRLSRSSLADTITSLRKSPDLPVYVIAVPGTNWRAHEVLQQLATGTGGSAFIPAKNSEFVDTTEAAAQRILGSQLSAEARAGREARPSENHEHNHKPLAGYQTVIVRAIPVAKTPATAEFDGGDNLLLQKVLVSRLETSRLFSQVEDATDKTGEDVRGTVSSSAAHTQLELLGTIIGYRRGNRAKRGTVGLFGAGNTRMKVQFVFRDVATGEPVLTVVKEGSGGGGLLASSDDTGTKAILQVVSSLIDDIKHNR